MCLPLPCTTEASPACWNDLRMVSDSMKAGAGWCAQYSYEDRMEIRLAIPVILRCSSAWNFAANMIQTERPAPDAKKWEDDLLEGLGSRRDLFEYDRGWGIWKVVERQLWCTIVLILKHLYVLNHFLSLF